MSPGRVFTLEEANALIPDLDRIVARQLALQAEIEDKLRHLALLIGTIPRELGLEDDDPADVRAAKSELIERIARYQRGWDEVAALGAVVKDPRMGLVDFYGHLEGRAVWLCWKYGEPRIDFFHELDTGFAGRKPLSEAARQRLLN